MEHIQDETSIAIRMQNALGFAIPTIIPLRETVTVKSVSDVEANSDLRNRLNSGLSAIAAVNYQVPVSLILEDGTGIKLPVDPIISLSGKNIITRRYVSKSSAGGTVKERWAQDDWEITIAGLLTDDETATAFEHSKRLRLICEKGKKGVDIICDLLNSYMGIKRFAIETFDFPFTKGVENQSFVLKGYSDGECDLLRKEVLRK